MFTVIVPVFNEEKTIERSIVNLLKFFKDNELRQYEIIIANDGSIDSTKEIAIRLSKRYGPVRYCGYEKNKGRGAVLKFASRYAKREKIVYMDADLATDLKSLPVMLDELDKHDIVIGSRYHPKSSTSRSSKRLILSKIFHSIEKALFPSMGISDSQCGFKGFRKAVLYKTNPSVRSDTWLWDLELMYKAKKKGFSLSEIPVVWQEQPTSTVRLIKDSFMMGFGLLKLRLKNLV